MTTRRRSPGVASPLVRFGLRRFDWARARRLARSGAHLVQLVPEAPVPGLDRDGLAQAVASRLDLAETRLARPQASATARQTTGRDPAPIEPRFRPATSALRLTRCRSARARCCRAARTARTLPRPRPPRLAQRASAGEQSAAARGRREPRAPARARRGAERAAPSPSRRPQCSVYATQAPTAAAASGDLERAAATISPARSRTSSASPTGPVSASVSR